MDSRAIEGDDSGVFPEPSSLLPELPEYGFTLNESFSFPDSSCFEAFSHQILSEVDLASCPDTSPSSTDPSMLEENGILHSSIDDIFVASCDSPGLINGLQSCRFDAQDRDSMALRRQQKHPRRSVSRARYSCDTCDKAFNTKYNRDRHSRYHHSQTSFYCPDCLTWSPLRRKDNYFRHRKSRHGESAGLITPHLTSPPSGHRRRTSWKKECLDFVSYVA